MDPSGPDRSAPDRSAAHLALQAALRSVDTFRAAQEGTGKGPFKRIVAALASRFVHFFADRQVEWNNAAARSLEATTRAIDDGDRWTSRIAAELQALAERLHGVETELRVTREAEAEARRKLAIAGVRLRELEELQQALAKRVDGEAPAAKATKD